MYHRKHSDMEADNCTAINGRMEGNVASCIIKNDSDKTLDLQIEVRLRDSNGQIRNQGGNFSLGIAPHSERPFELELDYKNEMRDGDILEFWLYDTDKI